MEPMSPVIPGSKQPEVVYAKDDPRYIPLPAHRSEDGLVITRWKLSMAERFQVFIGGSIWLSIMTFNRNLQPVKMESKCPVVEGSDKDVIDNAIAKYIGEILPASFHRWVTRHTGYIYAAVWLREQKKHQWMWVNEKQYYQD